ncbi:translation initiation factor 2 (bIF-2) [Dongia mobilis]|uniref:Translation initiation factor IF-2 n=1 Tax=Dongia mobilis TaxID=578943 RepID=A0A4R6WSB2_9PROT|nr:translation initiation factor IF-2 [Dongia mobilis]TDQ82361.1 translation initiation factor 2 (bIF-2) [Dongia mobilis]
MSSDTETPTRKPLKLSSPGKLELKKTVDGGQVRQSFPHGRTKTVAVEVKKKRTYTTGAGGKLEVAPEAEAPKPAAAAQAQVTTAAPEVEDRHYSLTEQERQARLKALEQAKKDEDSRKLTEAEEARRAAERSERERAELDRRRREEEERKAAEEAARKQREADEAVKAAAPAKAPAAGEAEGAHPHTGRMHLSKAIAKQGEEEDESARRRTTTGHRPPAVKTPVRGKDDQRRRGKLSVTQALDSEGSERQRSVAAFRRRTEKERRAHMMSGQNQAKVLREVILPEAITVQELANRMAERGADVIKALMKMGVMATINQTIDADTAELIIGEFGHTVRRVSAADVELGLEGEADIDDHLLPRPPVVTIMGHVDHGKTSLLDALRQTDVAAHEAGGITQHIGAYQVTLPSSKKITFIDTPGHAAFTEMRARGANVTDIVVLVVAGDDGIMPQTVEAIHHAKAAKVPILVAINKMDKPDANANRVRQELLSHELVTEEMGGDVLTVEVSAKTKMNLDKLEEALLLQAEILDLKANPDRSAVGAVVEAKMERGRGSVATLLVQKGTLKVGDIFVAGAEWGRVRALLDDRGRNIDSAGPAMPVEVLGLQGTPQAGDVFVVVESEARAREITEFRAHREREKQAAAGARSTLEQMFSKIQAGEAKEVPVVIKADVQGSVEAIVSSLNQLATDEVKARVLHAAVGGVNESDVTLARASGGMIIGFNVRANPQAREMAKRDHVDIRYYSIIYNVVDDIKAAMSGMLAPTLREKFLGNAEIREIFNITKTGKVAGCMVTEGLMKRGGKVRLLRDNVVIHEGTLKTLRRFKDEVREVKEGFECGMAFENYDNIEKGDVIECFEVEEVARALA